MSEWFHVGQRVQCIEDGWIGSTPLRRGAIYTIASIGTIVRGIYGATGESCPGETVLDLVEVKNPDDGMYPDKTPGFCARRFRPLRKRTTSIEVFKRLLVTPPKVDA